MPSNVEPGEKGSLEKFLRSYCPTKKFAMDSNELFRAGLASVLWRRYNGNKRSTMVAIRSKSELNEHGNSSSSKCRPDANRELSVRFIFRRIELNNSAIVAPAAPLIGHASRPVGIQTPHLARTTQVNIERCLANE